ncbi:MAG TPA: hypothetical protein VHT75_07685 [Acidimicrobiales bacterium]|nr:hypothetical protein [Acidimicrobiales bacterium]
MSVVTTVTLIAIGTGVLAGLIVLADVDLMVVRIFENHRRELRRTYARQPEPLAPAEPPRPLPWVAPAPRLTPASPTSPAWLGTSGPAWPAEAEERAPAANVEELSEGERWLAKMGAYASGGAGPFAREDAEAALLRDKGPATAVNWQVARHHYQEAS